VVVQVLPVATAITPLPFPLADLENRPADDVLAQLTLDVCLTPLSSLVGVLVDGQLVKEVFEECLRPAAHIRARLLFQHVTPEWQQRELWRSRVLGDSDIRHSSLGGVSVVRSSASSSAFSR